MTTDAAFTDLQVVPPGGHVAFEVAAGDRVRIVDLEGQQVTDFISFNRHDPKERLSMYTSRAVNGTWKLTAGHILNSTLSREMWRIEADLVGENYAGGGYCNRPINEKRYGIKDTPSCQDNFIAALAPFGLSQDDFDFETCFNVFMTVAYAANGDWQIGEPTSKAGDYIQFLALMDQIVAISNCPQVLNPCNAGRLKPVKIQVSRS
jgi:uncharacterized protein YcgI (DUF1989 family)